MRSKSKKQKKARDYSIVIPIITLIVGAVLGSGGVWQWKQFELNQKNYELEKAKYELEKIPKTIEIRNNIEGNMVKVLNLSKKHAELIKEIDKYPDGTREKENIGREIDRMWEIEFPLLKDSINQLESILSKLEKREPREFNLFGPPKAPMELRLSVDQNK